MTDAEKELRRLADSVHAAIRDGRDVGWPLVDFHAKATTSAILALLDRIEVLEKRLAPFEKAHEEALERVVQRYEP